MCHSDIYFAATDNVWLYSSSSESSLSKNEPADFNYHIYSDS